MSSRAFSCSVAMALRLREVPYHALMVDSDLATSSRHVCSRPTTDAFNAIAGRIVYNEREVGDVMPVVPIQVESEAGRGSTFPVVASTRAPGAVS